MSLMLPSDYMDLVRKKLQDRYSEHVQSIELEKPAPSSDGRPSLHLLEAVRIGDKETGLGKVVWGVKPVHNHALFGEYPASIEEDKVILMPQYKMFLLRQEQAPCLAITFDSEGKIVGNPMTYWPDEKITDLEGHVTAFVDMLKNTDRSLRSY